MDAARLLPLLGAFLLVLPVIWADPDAPGADIAREAIYLFAVWAGLILAAYALSRGLSDDSIRPADEAEGTSDGTPASGGTAPQPGAEPAAPQPGTEPRP